MLPTGIPKYRTLVAYVPQRTAVLPNTARAFLTTVQSFKSHKKTEKNPSSSDGPIEIASSWGLPDDTWDRPWSTLSGGEAQRVALAIAIGMSSAEILLLDGEFRNLSSISELIH